MHFEIEVFRLIFRSYNLTLFIHAKIVGGKKWNLTKPENQNESHIWWIRLYLYIVRFDHLTVAYQRTCKMSFLEWLWCFTSYESYLCVIIWMKMRGMVHFNSYNTVWHLNKEVLTFWKLFKKCVLVNQSQFFKLLELKNHNFHNFFIKKDFTSKILDFFMPGAEHRDWSKYHRLQSFLKFIMINPGKS